MNLEMYKGSNIEIEAEFKDPKTLKPIILFYHGILQECDDDSATIKDFKLGEITVNKTAIKKVKKMSHIEANITASKFNTIGDALRINPEIQQDVKMLDRKFKKFQKKL